MDLVKRLGFRYSNGKLWVFKAKMSNPTEEVADKPSWSVDIREILAMGFVGVAAICLIMKGYISEAMYLLVGLLGYATGRTIPVPKK